MTIATADIEPGDLLLFHGDSFVSWAIRKIDGSEVNHVAIALPDGQVAEAGGLGLQTRPLPTAFSDREYMLVRSHLAADPRDPVGRPRRHPPNPGTGARTADAAIDARPCRSCADGPVAGR
jgi:cell wall-associated NlpC family hydrolase